MSMPDKPAHDWESLASRKAPQGGETEQRNSSPDRIGPVPDKTSSTDESTSYLPSDRKGFASHRPSSQGEGAGNLTRLLLTAYLLLPLSIIALAALHHFLTSSHPRYDLEIGLSPENLRMLVVLVCFGPAFIPALWGLRIALRENHSGAAAHARALLPSLLYGADACLLRIFSVEVDPGPPVYYGDLFQVLDFLFLAPARLFSRLCQWGAILLGGWAVVRVVMGCTTLLRQKAPGWLARRVMASFLSGVWLLGISLGLLWAVS